MLIVLSDLSTTY